MIQYLFKKIYFIGNFADAQLSVISQSFVFDPLSPIGPKRLALYCQKLYDPDIIWAIF